MNSSRLKFAALLGAALLGSAGLCFYASPSPDALISYRTAVQLSGWLCVFAAAAAVFAMGVRRLGELMAVASAFFVGAALLYFSYFQWRELPGATPRAVALKSSRAVSAGRSASAGGSAPEVPRLTSERAEVPMFKRASAPEAPKSASPAPVAVEPCASLTGVRWVLCQERVRLEHCRGRDDSDPACPSVIPASPAH